MQFDLVVFISLFWVVCFLYAIFLSSYTIILWGFFLLFFLNSSPLFRFSLFIYFLNIIRNIPVTSYCWMLEWRNHAVLLWIVSSLASIGILSKQILGLPFTGYKLIQVYSYQLKDTKKMLSDLKENDLRIINVSNANIN